MTHELIGYQKAVAVTPHDSNAQTGFASGSPPGRDCDAIYVGGAGAVAAVSMGTAVTFAAVPVGTVLRIKASRINATNTTATNLVALWH